MTRQDQIPPISDGFIDGCRLSKWITRERSNLDRIACPGAIRRFIDPDADVRCVPTAESDIPGAPISHDEGLLLAWAKSARGVRRAWTPAS